MFSRERYRRNLNVSMASGGTSGNIRDHGVVLNKKRRVQCSYCGKELSGFHSLKRHLSGIGLNVALCEEVPGNVRERLRCMVLERTLSLPRDGTRLGLRKHVDSSPRGVKTGSGADEHDLPSKKARKCIGRFFLENGIDFSAVNSPSFGEMLSPGGDVDQRRYKIPSFRDMKGRIFQEEWEGMEEYVKRIRDSWAITGCSLLLDAWADVNGHDLVTFIADCPEGPIYLKSCDVSDIKGDMDALTSLVDEIVEEVGVQNVVQIIGCSVSGWVGELGKWFARCRRGIFWSLSASECFKLMLEEIGKLDIVNDILGEVKSISEFIHSDPSVLKLFRAHNSGKNPIVLSKNDVTTPYLTLESILKAETNLKAMFTSSDWENMSLDFGEEGIKVSRLMDDSSFWNTVQTVHECSIPLVHFLFFFAKSGEPQVGLIYDTMDSIKESIKKKLSGKKLSHKPFWDIIDEVWDTHLHNPLHAAGYYLNPHAFYSMDFHLDAEVATGLLISLIYIAKERRVLRKVLPQLDMYRLGEDSFFQASHSDKISGITPAKWWAQYADEHGELQRVAIKVLSQTCEGASRYKLKRRVAEEELLGGDKKSPLEHHGLSDFAFLHYNLHLRGCKASLDDEDLMGI